MLTNAVPVLPLPYGDGGIFAHKKSVPLAEIAQHGVNITKSMPDDKKSDLMDLFEEAYNGFEGKLEQTLSF